MKQFDLDNIPGTIDKFQFVLEFEDLYRSEEFYNRGLSLFERYASECTSLVDNLNIQLGVTFMKRSRSSESVESLLKRLDDISSAAQGVDDVAIKIEIVRAAIMTLRTRAYSECRQQLEDLYTRLNGTQSQFLFGLVAWYLGISYLWLAEYQKSETALQDALSVFRRFDHDILYAFSVSDYGVLKKRMCQYEESTRLLNQSMRSFEKLKLSSGQFAVCNNLGVVSLRKGDWTTSRFYFDRAETILAKLIHNYEKGDASFYRTLHANTEHLLVLQRKFEIAEIKLKGLISRYENRDNTLRLIVLAREFLGELYIETGQHEKAKDQLEAAYSSIKCTLPVSDISTEVTRRLAQLLLSTRELDKSRQKALECIRVCKKIKDEYELGTVLRILGEVHAKKKNTKKAVACFETAIQTLKGIHECYELMRTCIAYGAFLVDQKEPDAEIYLMEARQLCKKLEIDYFMAKINVELARHETNNDNFADARERLAEAEEIHDGIQACDQKQLRPLIDRANRDLDARIVKKSMTAAEEIKTICRVYEEARFPMDDMKPDLAYQVAQTVEAESLFLIHRKGSGYGVPLAYNIPVNEAKEIVRRLDRDRKEPILTIENDPKVFAAHTGHSLVCIPTHGEKGYVLCTAIAKDRTFSPRQFEFLFASAEAMIRLADGDDDKPVVNVDDFQLGDGISPITHPRGSFKDILTIDPGMIKLIRLAERASASGETMLLEGETGVGKELFANAIHYNSPRKDRPFVAINAGGMPISLLESQLFGHVKGAFTDAVTDRTGLIEDAQGGTVFLDEVGEMGPELQVKLLRLLENGEFRRLGENKVRIAQVRVVSATNRDLMKEVERGTFRRDLYYRLGTVKLHIPALRFRTRDIELLIRHFLKQCALRNCETNRYFEIDVKAIEALELYDWPGNVRELQNEIRRIVSLIGESDLIRFGMLSHPIKDYLKSKNRSDGLLERSVERYERRLILDALNKHDWNRLRTAEELGVPRTTLLAKIRRLNVAAR
jgi:transcriptional regulator with AAA-type ATPase domain/tetratricopeptide (TPR) repeat protein